MVCGTSWTHQEKMPLPRELNNINKQTKVHDFTKKSMSPELLSMSPEALYDGLD